MTEQSINRADAELIATIVSGHFANALRAFADQFNAEAVQSAAEFVADAAPVDIDGLDDAQIKQELRAAGYLNSQLKDQPHEVLVEALQKVYNNAVSDSGEADPEAEPEPDPEPEPEAGRRADYEGINPATGKPWTLTELKAVARKAGYKAAELKGKDIDGVLDLMFPEEAGPAPDPEDPDEGLDLPEDIYTRVQLDNMAPAELREIAATYDDVTFARGATQDDMVDALIGAENAWMALEGYEIELT